MHSHRGANELNETMQVKESAMGDFLTGALGAWFVLAAISAAGLWAIVH